MDKPEVLNTTTNPSFKPLRILIVLNLEWNPRLGAVRVYMELAEQWRAAGHFVEHFSFSDAYAKARATRAGFAIRQLLFAYRAAAFVRKNAARFDVIDALIGSLPMSKEKLGFAGLLVARSVGLYRLYERFEVSADQRWPDRARGKVLGRVFYKLVRRLLFRASDNAVWNADLINVPNEDEANCLRQDGSARAITVHPYGLSVERRQALLKSAASRQARLAGKKICFIGMWSPRKGSRDWAQIIRRVRERIPEAQFSFLGTMVNGSKILSELGSDSLRGIESVPEYSPDDLPRLLSDCAVGVFPSYVEGFGLAVLEQLGAGIPTVAFDVAGPRDVLSERLNELLVPVGDIEGISAAICKVLELDADSYDGLSHRSVETAAAFDWFHVAENTIVEYREHLGRGPGELVFTQPFGLGSAGGGARILRALLQVAPMECSLVCTSPEAPSVPDLRREVHMPIRPYFGRVERTRFARLPRLTAPLFRRRFVRRFERLCRNRDAVAVHAIPHGGLDFHYAHLTAAKLGIPFLLQVHDDFAFSSRGHVAPSKAQRAMHTAWRDAAARFVISDPLGQEYCRRYGKRDYTVVTDGLEVVASRRVPPSPDRLRIYFMGLFHLEYEDNLRVLCRALKRLRTMRPSIETAITLRCGTLRLAVKKTAPDLIRVLPLGTELDVQRDLELADLLYLPLPFDEAFDQLVRFSLSTKLVTYLGSGKVILYHGPQRAALHALLSQHSAALFHSSLEVDSLAGLLCRVCDDPQSTAQICANGLQLARAQFMLQDQRVKFWDAVIRVVGQRASAGLSQHLPLVR